MTETLQNKIDNILRDTISEHWQAIMINKAIQELREEILKIEPRQGTDGVSSYQLMIYDVLALIGEKK